MGAGASTASSEMFDTAIMLLIKDELNNARLNGIADKEVFLEIRNRLALHFQLRSLPISSEIKNLPAIENKILNCDTPELLNITVIPTDLGKRNVEATTAPAIQRARSTDTFTSKQQLSEPLTPIFTVDVLRNSATFKMFLDHASARQIPHGIDMLKFWQEVDVLQSLPSHTYTYRRLRKIYDKFLAKDAITPVCVTSQMLQSIEKALENENVLSAGMYTEAQSICLIALEESVFPRFKKAPLFQEMKAACTDDNGNSSTALDTSLSISKVDSGFTLFEILHHPKMLQYLKLYCMQVLALENVLFYLEVEDCKRLPNASFVATCTKKIYDRYCDPRSQNYIALPNESVFAELHATVEKINSSSNSEQTFLTPRMFYDPQTACFNTIAQQMWPSFSRKMEYIEHAKKVLSLVRPGSASFTSQNQNYQGKNSTNLHQTLLPEVREKLGNLNDHQLIDIALRYPVQKLLPIELNEMPKANPDLLSEYDFTKLTPEIIAKKLLADPIGKRYIMSFMVSRQVDHLLAFIDEVDMFKRLPGMEFLQHTAKKIYRKYIMPSAKLQVDMSTEMRNDIEQKLENPTMEMFKKILVRIRGTLLQDSLPRFIKSKYYTDLKQVIYASMGSQNEDSLRTSSHARNRSKAILGNSASAKNLDNGRNSIGDADPEVVCSHLLEIDESAKVGKLEFLHLDYLLLNQTCLTYFRKFLETQHCVENMMLWEEIEAFRRLPSYQIVIRTAQKLVDKYLRPTTSKRPIPVPISKFTRLMQCFEVQSPREDCGSEIHRHTFDEIVQECNDVIWNVIIPDFCDSRLFMAMVGAWAVICEDYPAEMLIGELELAFLRHRFNLVAKQINSNIKEDS